METRIIPEGFFEFDPLSKMTIINKGVAEIANLPPADLQELHTGLQTMQRQIKVALDQINAALDQRYGDQTAAIRRERGKDFGVCHLSDGPLQITVDLPKRVIWDQEKLAAIATRIAAAGERVNDFIDIDYSISESRYTNWPSTLKEQFSDARTVKPGKASYRLALVKENQQ